MKLRIILTLLLVSLTLLGEYQLKVKVKYPFESERIVEDTVVRDSGAVGTKVQVNLQSKDGRSIKEESIVTEEGFASLKFQRWEDRSTLEIGEIETIDITCPRMYRVIKEGGRVKRIPITFRDVHYLHHPPWL